MKKAIVGKKIGMTQVFTDDGRLVPVTVVEAGPCKVVQKKSVESDGYSAVQVGFDTLPENRAKKLINKKPTKAMWADVFEPETGTGLVKQSDGRPVLVYGSDPRPPYTGAASADEFDTGEDGDDE